MLTLYKSATFRKERLTRFIQSIYLDYAKCLQGSRITLVFSYSACMVNFRIRSMSSDVCLEKDSLKDKKKKKTLQDRSLVATIVRLCGVLIIGLSKGNIKRLDNTSFCEITYSVIQ